MRTVLLLIEWNMFSLSPLRHGNSRRPAYAALRVTALIGLVTFWPPNRFTGYRYILPILDFLDVSFLKACDRQTDGQTDTANHFIMLPTYGNVTITVAENKALRRLLLPSNRHVK